MAEKYEPMHWEDEPQETTPLSAANLNRMEQGIAGAYDYAEALIVGSGESSVAIGMNSDAAGARCVAIGADTQAGRPNPEDRSAIAIGNSAEAPLNNSIAIGTLAHANEESSIAIGESAGATGYEAIAVGSLANARFDASIAIGPNAASRGIASIAIGEEADARGTDFPSVAIGREAVAQSGGIAMGFNSEADPNSIAIGLMALAFAQSSIAIGENARAFHDFAVAIGTNAVTTDDNDFVLGNVANHVRVPGDFSVAGSKSFEIPHPHPAKRETHYLRHGAVEAPTPGENLYRYTVEAHQDGQTVEVELPDYFPYLNKDVDVWVSPHMHFGRAFGYVEGDRLKVTCEKAGIYKALVIGTRNDPAVKAWYIRGVERRNDENWLGKIKSAPPPR